MHRGRRMLPSPSAVQNQQPVLGRLLLRHCLKTIQVRKATQMKSKGRLLCHHPPAKKNRSLPSSKQGPNRRSSRRTSRSPSRQVKPPNLEQPRIRTTDRVSRGLSPPSSIHRCNRNRNHGRTNNPNRKSVLSRSPNRPPTHRGGAHRNHPQSLGSIQMIPMSPLPLPRPNSTWYCPSRTNN